MYVYYNFHVLTKAFKGKKEGWQSGTCQANWVCINQPGDKRNNARHSASLEDKSG